MTLVTSKVERLSRQLRRLAVVLCVLWLVAAASAIAWVDDEWAGEASIWRYITAVADVGMFLIASVLAYVGSALVEAIGRIRSSIITAMFEQTQMRELEQAEEQPAKW